MLASPLFPINSESHCEKFLHHLQVICLRFKWTWAVWRKDTSKLKVKSTEVLCRNTPGHSPWSSIPRSCYAPSIQPYDANVKWELLNNLNMHLIKEEILHVLWISLDNMANHSGGQGLKLGLSAPSTVSTCLTRKRISTVHMQSEKDGKVFNLSLAALHQWLSISKLTCLQSNVNEK